MLLEQIGGDGSATRLVFLAHKRSDIVADLHAAGLQRVPHGVGLHVAVLLGQRLEDLLLHILARMAGKCLHRIERD